MPKIRLRLVFLLPFVHLCACLIIALARMDSAWEYLLTIDAPMSSFMVGALYTFDHPLIVIGILGTLWWYLLSRGAEIAGTRLVARFRKYRRVARP